MKRYSPFHQNIESETSPSDGHIRTFVGGLYYPYVKIQSAYSTASADRNGIYIYVCVCVCVCKHVLINNKDTFCLYNFIKILSSFLINVLFSGWNWWMNLPKLSRAPTYLLLAIIRGCLRVYSDTFG